MKNFPVAILLALILSLALVLPLLAGSDAEPGDIVINEIMLNPVAVSDIYGEWLEVYNTSAVAIDINGWTLKDVDVDEHVIDNGGPLLVAPGAYVVLCRNNDPEQNGGVTCDYVYNSFQLANTDDEVILVDNGVLPQEIAHVDYSGGLPWPYSTGKSIGYIPSAKPPAVGYFLDNNDYLQWCTSTSELDYGDKGTPGSRNDACGPTAITLHAATAGRTGGPGGALPLVILLLGAGLVVTTGLVRGRHRTD